MKTNAQLLLLLIGIFFFSCNSTVKNQIIPISNIDTDFPVTEKLEFKPFNKFDIFERGFCMIDDSILWSVEENEDNFGFCYDLNTGTVSYTHLRAHETRHDLVCRLLLEKKKK